MSKFFTAAALGLGLFFAAQGAQAAPAAPHHGQPGVTQVQYRGGPPHHRHYAPPPRPHHRYAPPPPRRHHGWQAPYHRPHRHHGWR